MKYLDSLFTSSQQLGTQRGEQSEDWTSGLLSVFLVGQLTVGGQGAKQDSDLPGLWEDGELAN